MTQEDPKTSGVLTCGHCSNATPMEIVAEHSGIERHETDDSHFEWEEGPVYKLLKCPNCSKITLRKYYWHDSRDVEDLPKPVILYPTSRAVPKGLPENIKKEFETAQRLRGIDPNAYGVHAGRVLELVCQDRGAKGKFLGQQLEYLAQHKEIPEKLTEVATGLKDLRNVGAHAALGELTEEEVPILEDLTRAILDYIYQAPHLAQMVEDRLKALKG